MAQLTAVRLAQALEEARGLGTLAVSECHAEDTGVVRAGRATLHDRLEGRVRGEHQTDQVGVDAVTPVPEHQHVLDEVRSRVAAEVLRRQLAKAERHHQQRATALTGLPILRVVEHVPQLRTKQAESGGGSLEEGRFGAARSRVT